MPLVKYGTGKITDEVTVKKDARTGKKVTASHPIKKKGTKHGQKGS